MFGKKKNIVEEYKGNEANARKLFLRDAEKKAKKGYYPISENWTPGSYGIGAFIVALLLCFILIGFIVFIYMLIVKPAGTLTVTYEYRETQVAPISKEKKNTTYDFIKVKGKFLTYDSASGIGVIMTDSGKKLDFNIAMWDDPEAVPEVGLDNLNIYNKEGKLSIMTKSYKLERYEKLAAAKK